MFSTLILLLIPAAQGSTLLSRIYSKIFSTTPEPQGHVQESSQTVRLDVIQFRNFLIERNFDLPIPPLIVAPTIKSLSEQLPLQNPFQTYQCFPSYIHGIEIVYDASWKATGYNLINEAIDPEHTCNGNENLQRFNQLLVNVQSHFNPSPYYRLDLGEREFSTLLQPLLLISEDKRLAVAEAYWELAQAAVGIDRLPTGRPIPSNRDVIRERLALITTHGHEYVNFLSQQHLATQEASRGLYIGAGSFGRMWHTSWGGQFAAGVWLEVSHDDRVIPAINTFLEAQKVVRDNPNFAQLIACQMINPFEFQVILDVGRGLSLSKFFSLLHKGKLESLRGTYLPLPIFAAIFHKVVEAVYFLHRRGIVAGDLKLSNIYLTEEGQVKIMDLSGVANYQSIYEPVKPVPAITPGFAPPEIAATYAFDAWTIGANMLKALGVELTSDSYLNHLNLEIWLRGLDQKYYTQPCWEHLKSLIRQTMKPVGPRMIPKYMLETDFLTQCSASKHQFEEWVAGLNLGDYAIESE